MAEDLRIALQELLRKAELDNDVDFLREGIRVMAQQLMELEVAQHVGAEKIRTRGGSQWRAQWLSRPNLGHARRQHRATAENGRKNRAFPLATHARS
jgi:hypothetical protein